MRGGLGGGGDRGCGYLYVGKFRWEEGICGAFTWAIKSTGV